MEQSTDMEMKETKNQWNGAKTTASCSTNHGQTARQKTVLQQHKGLEKEAGPAALGATGWSS
jgi:hypothetical protein